MDEIILMRKLKRKDEWALGKIIDLYSSYITCIVWELLHKKGTKEDIEEVVADTFISLWLTAERINYKKYSSVKSYLGMIARNKAKDWLRAYRGEILELNDDILLIDGDVEHLILQKEQQLIIGRTLEKLRETDRKIFIMYYYRYKKIEEIAETLKMNPQTVKTRLRRGRETLKRILLEEGYVDSDGNKVFLPGESEEKYQNMKNDYGKRMRFNFVTITPDDIPAFPGSQVGDIYTDIQTPEIDYASITNYEDMLIAGVPALYRITNGKITEFYFDSVEIEEFFNSIGR